MTMKEGEQCKTCAFCMIYPKSLGENDCTWTEAMGEDGTDNLKDPCPPYLTTCVVSCDKANPRNDCRAYVREGTDL